MLWKNALENEKCSGMMLWKMRILWNDALEKCSGKCSGRMLWESALEEHINWLFSGISLEHIWKGGDTPRRAEEEVGGAFKDQPSLISVVAISREEMRTLAGQVECRASCGISYVLVTPQVLLMGGGGYSISRVSFFMILLWTTRFLSVPSA